MIVQIADARTIRLDDAHNFRKFHVQVDLPESRLADLRDAFPGTVAFEDAATAWVSIPALRAWPALTDDQAWQQGLSAMIEKAAPHGWVDTGRDAIKAHVVWQAAAGG
jgi:hypothetical protein